MREKKHPEVELIPFLRGELTPAERERVERHLGECPRCGESAAELAGLLRDLKASAPEPPEIDWRRYRAELRTRLAEREERRSRWALPRLVPAAGLAAVAALALLLLLRPATQQDTSGEGLLAFDETAIGGNLELLQNFDVVANLDLLEDLDVVQDLDGLLPTTEG